MGKFQQIIFTFKLQLQNKWIVRRKIDLIHGRLCRNVTVN